MLNLIHRLLLYSIYSCNLCHSDGNAAFGWSCSRSGCTGSCVASLDPFSCQTRVVSPVDGSVFLCNFRSAGALETLYKETVLRLSCSLAAGVMFRKQSLRLGAL